MSVEPQTHLKMNPRYSGTPVRLEPGFARVELETIPEMAADEYGLVHGGFAFSLLDYAAMLAVNEPNVVLAEATVKFKKPTRVGQTLAAEAKLNSREGKKCKLSAVLLCEGQAVGEAEFFAIVPENHVLS